MRRLPLFRYSGRARSTSWAIALCTMFIVAGFSIVGGLGTSMGNLSSSLESEKSIILLPTESGNRDFFDPSALGDIASEAALGIYFEGSMYLGPDFEESASIGTVCIVDEAGVLGESFSVEGAQVLLGTDYSYRGEVEFMSLGDLPTDHIDAVVTGGFSSSMFPSSWAVVSLELAEEITGLSGVFNLAIVSGISDDESSLLSSKGFAVTSLTGIVPFLESGVDELEADAFWMLVPSCFAIVVLAYGFMGSEVSDRRHEIGILKTVGAGRRRILSYLLLDALLISLWGGLLGVALGIVVSYAVSTAASVMFTSVFLMKASEPLLLAALAVTVAAGVAGALVPAVRMTMSPPVEDLKEVGPSD